MDATEVVNAFLVTPSVDTARECLAGLENAKSGQLDSTVLVALQNSVAEHLLQHSDYFWCTCRIAAQLIVDARLHTPAVTILTADSLSCILVQLGEASGSDGVADAFAAAQVLLHGVYRTAPELREPIRLGLFLLLRLLAERVENTGEVGDALCVRSVIRLLHPIMTGMRLSFELQPDAATRYAVSFLSRPLIGACVAPQAFEAFGTAWYDLLGAIMSAAPEDMEDEVRTAVIEELCDEFGGKAAHFRSAAVARILGRTINGASQRVILDSLERITTVVTQGLQSDVPAVCTACIATCSEGLLQSILQDDVHQAVLDKIAKSMMGDQRKLHWDVEVVLEMGRLWTELSAACGDRWASAAAQGEQELNKLLVASRRSVATRAFGDVLLEKCATVQREREESAAQSHVHREAAVVELSARTDLRHMNFVIGRELGSGAFSTVKFAKFIQREVPQGHWLPVAIKSAYKAVVQVTPEGKQALERELQLHRVLSNDPDTRDGVVRLFAHFEDLHHVNMVMELCPNGDLYSAVLGEESSSARHVAGFWRNGAAALWLRSVLWDVAHVIHEAHVNCGIMIGDIKPENVVIASSGRGKVADFGASMRLADVGRATSVGGTLHYMAPELLRWSSTNTDGARSSEALDGAAADWWSFAMMCAHLLTGRLPFDSPDPTATRERIKTLTPAVVSALPLWSTFPAFVQQILLTCSSPAVRAKQAFDWIREDPYFADCDPPFMGTAPRMPPHLAAAAATATRNSGRKQSVMWRKQASADALQASSIAVDILSGDVQLLCEDPSVAPLFDPVVFELLPRKGHQSSSGGRGRGGGGGSNDLSSYMTTRPPLPRR